MVVNWILEKLAGNHNEKQLKKIAPLVTKINEYYESRHGLSDQQIKAKTEEFKARLQAGESLDDILPEAFATVKQAAKRMVGTEIEVKGIKETWNMIPYDVQLIGGIVLHQGKIAEMRTGEGKTLVATLPAYLNALDGKWVHIVTVNDYLASRDAEWMGHLYAWLGLTVGSVTKGTSLNKRRELYQCDITYIENSELGFDYLRDNLATSLDDRVVLRRPLNYAVVDEVDSILVDEARTPLIISQASEEATEKYAYYAKIVPMLTASKVKKKVPKWLLHEIMNDTKWEEQEDDGGDYFIDEKLKTVTLSSAGIKKIEDILGVQNLYKDLGYQEIHHIENALKAHAVYLRDKDYIIRDGEVLIVDDHTGRVMPGRRYSQGLHQAIEAKEVVEVQRESRTLATITYQHFFKQYKKLCGMTGTASTEAEEFEKIYDVETFIIPTNNDIIRVDQNDRVYYDQHAKRKAVMEHISFYHQNGVPILIGTSSIQTSEYVSGLLQKNVFPHYVLNAKFHEQEANIVMNAGKLGSLVVATNMAWRGTDIKLEKNLKEQLAEKYAQYIQKRIAKWLGFSGVVYSSKEYELLIEQLKGVFELTDETIRQALRGRQKTEKVELKIVMNTKKKTKDDALAEVRIVPAGNQNAEMEERDIHMWLFILGTEKHDSRRIDNQLRGRAGRQWDPGLSVFFVALDDEIMRKMGGEKIQSLAKMMLGKDELETTAFTQSQFTSSIQRAQKQMESRHFGIRKHLYEYDTVINKQRQAIYAKRDWMLELEAKQKEQAVQAVQANESQEIEGVANIIQLSVRDEIKHFIDDVVAEQITLYTAYTPWNLTELCETLQQITGAAFLEEEYVGIKSASKLQEKLTEQIHQMFTLKLDADENKERVEDICRRIYLSVIDKFWMEHIDEMQYLREKVSLYGYAQLDPLVIYKKEAFDKYQALLMTIKKETLGRILRTELIGTDAQLLQEAVQIANSGATTEWSESVLGLLREAAEYLGQQWNAQPAAAQWRGGRVVAEVVNAKGEKKTIETTYGQANILEEGSDVEVLEVEESRGGRSGSTGTTNAVAERKDHGKLRPNDKVSVKHADGRMEYDVKWKKVKEEVEAGKAQLV